MPPFPKNPQRYNPYAPFRFRLKFDRDYVAGVNKITALKCSTAVIEYVDGADPFVRKSPGRTTYEAITLERGVTHDLEFERWANKVWNLGATGVSLADFRKDIMIDVFNEAGQKVLSYHVFRCWVSEYQALPDLDANASGVAIQTLKLENEGWLRDLAVTEPKEPSFTDLA